VRPGMAVEHLQDQSRGGPFAPGARDLEKFVPPLQSLRRLLHGSGRQPFTPSGTTVGQHLASANGRFTRAESVAPLAHEYAGLICAFQDNTPAGLEGAGNEVAV